MAKTVAQFTAGISPTPTQRHLASNAGLHSGKARTDAGKPSFEKNELSSPSFSKIMTWKCTLTV